MSSLFKIIIAVITVLLLGAALLVMVGTIGLKHDPVTTEAPAVLEERQRGELLQTIIPNIKLAVGEPLTDEAKAAIETLKATLGDETLSPAVRARNADTLLGFYNIERSPDMFAAIFSGEPFGQFAHLDPKEATKAATLYLLSEYPTSRSYLRLANWYATELLDNTQLSPEDTQRYKTEALNNLTKADEVYTTQESSVQSEHGFTTVIYRHWRGIVLGYLALSDNDKAALEAARDDFLYVQTTVIQSRDRSLTSVLPYSLFYEAAFLATLTPEKEIEIEMNVQNIVEFLQSGRTTKNDFLRFMTAEGKRTEETRDHNYTFFTTLAKESTVFELFLRNNGFQLDEVR